MFKTTLLAVVVRILLLIVMGFVVVTLYKEGHTVLFISIMALMLIDDICWFVVWKTRNNNEN
jgi:hypothetical protein